jgi:hypothetical protein
MLYEEEMQTDLFFSFVHELQAFVFPSPALLVHVKLAAARTGT